MKHTTVLYFACAFIKCIITVTGDTDNIPITPDEFAEVKYSMNFRGKVVLVSGSSSGIGAATVRLFSYLGAQVVVTGRNQARISEVASECWKLSPYHHKVCKIWNNSFVRVKRKLTFPTAFRIKTRSFDTRKYW